MSFKKVCQHLTPLTWREKDKQFKSSWKKWRTLDFNFRRKKLELKNLRPAMIFLRRNLKLVKRRRVREEEDHPKMLMLGKTN